MTETIIEHLYKLKGGEQEAVERNNPFLERREPIVVYFTDGITRMKIGDGIHRYNELEWIGGKDSGYEKQIVTYPDHFKFPQPGDSNLIYRAQNESVLYQWDANYYRYEPLVNADVDINISDIETINGGRASELLIV